MPFAEPTGELPVGERKYDQDTTNRLRVLETLHYHSVSNPKYIHELRTAMVQTGIVAEKVKTLELKLKASFKEAELYNRGYVFVNNQESYVLNEDVVSLGDGISNRVYKVHINSGRMSTGLIFGNEDSQTSSIPYRMFKFKDLGSHVIRAAINRSDAFKYSELKVRYPNLKSVKEFVESPSYLAGINIQVYAAQNELDDMEQKNKLYCAVEVLKQIEPLLSKGGVGYKGLKQFRPEYVRDVFREKSQNFALDSSSDKEYGKSMKETENPELRMDLSCADWYAYEDCFGTSEEKYLIRYIESIYPKLAEKFDDIYLLRNEKDLKIYSFDTGEAYQPDYVLFLKKKNDGGKADYIQIFIEPKGLHLRTADKWKEDALGQIRENADILFPTQGAGFNVWGMPFFTESKRRIFEEAICDALGI